jgi:glycine/D-amino acid oxidase-like deaminating enzyme
MKLRSKETYWLLKNGLIASYPSLQNDVNCDVLIIGGGVTGALIAYQLSKEGYKTIVVDKRDIGMGSTSATTAMIQYEIDEPLYSLIKMVGENAAVDSYKEGVLVIDQLASIIKATKTDCGFKRKQSLFIAASASDRTWLQQEFECRRTNGFKVHWLTAQQLKKQFGIIGHGAIVSDAAASLDAYKLAHSLLAYSVKHFGLKVFDHTEIETLKYSKQASVAITERKHSIKCKYIVNATGYESPDRLRDKVVKLISTYAWVSEPIASIPSVLRNSLLWNTESPYLYMRSTTDSRVLVGGADENFKDATKRDKLIEKKENVLLKKAIQLMPSLKLIPDFTWAGTFGVTKDALPFIGADPDHANSYFVLGFGGNGITFSVMGMKIISDALAGKHNKFLEYFRFNR